MIEAGSGSLSCCTEHAAERRGYPGDWKYDNAVIARLEANATGRPGGASAPCPDESWEARTSITPDERAVIRQTVTALRSANVASADQEWLNQKPMNQPRCQAGAS